MKFVEQLMHTNTHECSNPSTCWCHEEIPLQGLESFVAISQDSWLNLLSMFIGAPFGATCAYLRVSIIKPLSQRIEPTALKK